MSEEITKLARRRVLSGMRPTGKLHLGNYMGALKNWVDLQNATHPDGGPMYECYFFIADWHALTTDYADTSRVAENTVEVALDFLSAGLDPEKSTIFVQSHVTQHAELHLLLSMITPLSWLERVPSYKDQQDQLRQKDLNTYGFLGYPLLQSADILLYRPEDVPVGHDQIAHVEITREIARRFNQFYGGRSATVAESFAEAQSDREKMVELEGKPRTGTVILREPSVLLTPSPKLPGTDGRKMSKSYGNTIMLTDPAHAVRAKMESMTNGGQRFLQSEPGDPDRCPVGEMHKLFSTADLIAYTRDGCRSALIGCLVCKQLAGDSISKLLKPIQDERFQLELDSGQVFKVLDEGAERARCCAEETMSAVRKAMKLSRVLVGAQVESSLDRGFRDAGFPPLHDLKALSQYWDDDARRPQVLRSYWLDKIVPRDIALNKDSDRVFVTATKKRVYVTTSHEVRPGTWNFNAKAKSYEMLVLLCWDREFLLHDFIVPQKVYVQAWSRLKKLDKSADIHFVVSRSETTYMFELDGESHEITRFRGNYEPMR
jgi:tryptophanyl-tRNA synthetase